MSHRTALRHNRHARKAAAAMIIAVAALGLTACQDGETDSSSSPSASASAPQSTAPTAKDQGQDQGQDQAKDTAKGTPRKPGMKCTNQIDYAGDPRDNATINSIGNDTGYCPPIQKDETSKGTLRKGDMKCTDQ
ncbi:hypothetical protein, partial [Streptomyces rhizosphaericus]